MTGRLFHTIGPEYIKLCLNISFFGLGGMKLEEIADLKSGIFSSKILPLGSLPRNIVVRITDRPDMTSAFHHGR